MHKIAHWHQNTHISYGISHSKVLGLINGKNLISAFKTFIRNIRLKREKTYILYFETETHVQRYNRIRGAKPKKDRAHRRPWNP